MNATPGWYPNPDGSGDWRWWDGGAWGPSSTAHRAEHGLPLVARVAGICFGALGTFVVLVGLLSHL